MVEDKTQTYIVRLTMTRQTEIDVEATSYKEALKKAQKELADLAAIFEDERIAWTIDEVEDEDGDVLPA